MYPGADQAVPGSLCGAKPQCRQLGQVLDSFCRAAGEVGAMNLLLEPLCRAGNGVKDAKAI